MKVSRPFYLYALIAIAIFASFAVLYLRVDAEREAEPTAGPGLPESSQKLLDASALAMAELASRQNWIEPGRECLRKCLHIAQAVQSGQKVSAEPQVLTGRVERGDTLESIIEKAGSVSAAPYVKAAARVFPLRSFRAGQPYAIYADPQTGKIQRFEYEVDDRRKLVIEGSDLPRARMEDIPYDTMLAVASGKIEDSLFQTVADIGESPQLALRLVDLFGSEINFIKDIQDGDTFSVLIEKRYREDKFRGYGRILGAQFTNRGKTWEAWLFRDGTGKLQHYNGKGENLKKTLLMAPLAVTRLTSHFSHNRKHPILGTAKPHLGVDYGAPAGTPVKAVGDGVVTKRGWAGGYGNQIVIQHNAELESWYAHLSRFGRGLKIGQKVKQGQVIGFVGSTGLATGPHLDFRLTQKGKFINPVKAINPRGAPVQADNMKAFRKIMEIERAYLQGRELPADYKTDSIIPAFAEKKQDSVSRKKPQKTSRRNRYRRNN